MAAITLSNMDRSKISVCLGCRGAVSCKLLSGCVPFLRLGVPEDKDVDAQFRTASNYQNCCCFDLSTWGRDMATFNEASVII
jgi:hypothetical protein